MIRKYSLKVHTLKSPRLKCVRFWSKSIFLDFKKVGIRHTSTYINTIYRYHINYYLYEKIKKKFYGRLEILQDCDHLLRVVVYYFMLKTKWTLRIIEDETRLVNKLNFMGQKLMILIKYYTSRHTNGSLIV